MYCSGCGQALQLGQGLCPRCGRPTTVAPPPVMPPPVPGFQFELASYASKVRALSTVWFIYAAITLIFSFVGMAFARAFMFNHLGPWGRWNSPFRPEWFGPAFLHFVWVFVALRAALLFAAGWGLMERAPWGRMLAIVAAFLSLVKFPVGTALGIWTLVTLMGYRNQALYEQLP